MPNHPAVKRIFIPIFYLALLVWLPLSGHGTPPPTTREQTILPRPLPPGTPPIAPSNVALYAVYGYNAWDIGPGTNEDRKLNLMPSGYAGAANAARLATFFAMTDVHLTDKESPAEVPYMGWTAAFTNSGPGGLNHAAYSPVMFDTPRHIDAAVRTINALHQVTPFQFGLVLGDVCNAGQYNELRWFIDVMDGQYITPSSGAHLGADTIDYQLPFQAAGLDHSIPWFQAIGNHDQFWMGIGYPSDKVLQAMVGSNILEIGTDGPLQPPYGAVGNGVYVGTVDGTTPYGSVILWGLTNLFAAPPAVAADTNRHGLTLDVAAPTNYTRAFFDTASSPRGHGFGWAANAGSLAACYAFEPVTNLPLKVIVLDDTCKSNLPNQNPNFYGSGWVDAARYAWLTNELQLGQDADQLMIVATHIPILPQRGLGDTNSDSMFYPSPDNQAETNLIATLQRYPNLLMVLAGHRHVNVVTPFPSRNPAHPEYGFWEVETASLRDYPRQFRTFDILRNGDNSISILATDVDPEVASNTPAWKSLGYAIGAARVFGGISLTDTTSYAYNAELVKFLTPAMQAKIANYGAPLAQNAAADFDGDRQADPAVYVASNGVWYLKLSTMNYDLVPVSFGGPGYRACAEDYDGDGKADPAVYQSATGNWYVRLSGSGYTVVSILNFGGAGDEPAAGDYDGDGKADPAIYNAGNGAWRVAMSSLGYGSQSVNGFGGANYRSVQQNYDSDTRTDAAVYNNANGNWTVLLSAGNYITATVWGFGGLDFTPVTGDFDGDGLADPAIYQAATGTWGVKLSGNGYAPAALAGFGGCDATASAADFDGDRRADPALFNLATGRWHIKLSTLNYCTISISSGYVP